MGENGILIGRSDALTVQKIRIDHGNECHEQGRDQGSPEQIHKSERHHKNAARNPKPTCHAVRFVPVFFPFFDNIDRAKKSGVKYIAEPGGSVRDDLVIERANGYDMVMAFTGMRLFHH